MDLNDLYKLAGIQRSDTPAVEPQEVEQQVIEEPTVDGREDMKAMIALVSPEQLNKLVGNAPVEEDMPGENVTTKANPQEFKHFDLLRFLRLIPPKATIGCLNFFINKLNLIMP